MRLALLWFVVFGGLAPAQPTGPAGLPRGAVVIERAAIPANVHPQRELVLWMLSPEKHDRGALSESNPYTCPEMTLGSYYSGPTRISLVDSGSGRVIDSVELRHEEEDSFSIPYRIVAGSYYLVPGKAKGTEGKPTLLALRDLNGDGLALEIAFFEAESCMGLATTAFGYSARQDKVIQYPVVLEVRQGKLGAPATETRTWVDYLFSKKPIEPGHWHYAIDYRGRAGTLDTYDIRYDATRERFTGTLLCEGEP